MSTITVTIKEESVFNGTDHGSEFVSSITGVTTFYERSILCTQTEMNLISFSSSASGSTFTDGSLKYARITNTDTTNFVVLRVLGTGQEYFVKLEPEASYLLFNDNMDANATGSQVASLANIDEIKAAVDPAATPGTTAALSIFAAA